MHNGRCLSAKPPLSVIAQEINRVNGGLVLKPKLLSVENGNNTHMRTSKTHLEIYCY